MESFGLLNLLKSALFSTPSADNSPSDKTDFYPPSTSSQTHSAANTTDGALPRSEYESPSKTNDPTKIPRQTDAEQNAFLLFMDAHDRRSKRIKR
ncbi:MAG: hypothetical protein IJX87_05275 [Clostridia bacterium]|nr:hypothetical protein [Clostridia bacterium]